MANRRAGYAGSWYNGDGEQLDRELTSFLAAVNPTPEEDYTPPIGGCKAIIAPHAGYAYSGPTAAWAYKSIDTTGIKRVFVLGPTHVVYIDGCGISRCHSYQTPIGELPLDLATIKELGSTGQFKYMDLQTDEEEYSIEIHLPFIRKVFEGKDISIVPILVGSIDREREESFGRALAPFLARDDTICVVSSDFCHWGTRFQYSFYYSSPPPSSIPAIRLSRGNISEVSLSTRPIHESIHDLDHEAMELLTLRPSGAHQAHVNFAEYLARTRNTICGRHPIGVLLGALSGIEDMGKTPKLKWVRYDRSSLCFTMKDSSVSYASAYVTI